MNINQLLQLRKTMYFYHTDILLFVQQNKKKARWCYEQVWIWHNKMLVFLKDQSIFTIVIGISFIWVKPKLDQILVSKRFVLWVLWSGLLNYWFLKDLRDFLFEIQNFNICFFLHFLILAMHVICLIWVFIIISIPWTLFWINKLMSNDWNQRKISRAALNKYLRRGKLWCVNTFQNILSCKVYKTLFQIEQGLI